MKKSTYQKAITLRGLCVIILLVAVALGFLGPKYVGQFEKLRIMSMQAMLINVVIAEDLYQAKHGSYTDQWNELMPYVTQPETLELQLKEVSGQPQTYFFGFGKNAARKQRGYWVSLSLQADKKNGMITAVRTNNWLYPYELRLPFPLGYVDCRGSRLARGLCKRFQADVEELQLTNLKAVPSSPTKNSEKSSVVYDEK